MTLGIKLTPEGRLMLDVPSGESGSYEHDISEYTDAKAMAFIIHLLRAQARTTSNAERRLGNECAPTLTQIEQWLRQGHKVTKLNERGKVELTLEDLE